MHEVRLALLTGEKPDQPSRVSREKCRRRAAREGSLIGIEIPRQEQRLADQRREERFRGVRDHATIVFRRKQSLVRVINISTSGIMIDSGLTPRIGETVSIVFNGQEPLEGIVRWIKQGRIGLDVGEGNIALD